MFTTIRSSFRAALVTGALTALSVTFLTSLAESDAARAGHRVRPATMSAPAWPQSGAVRVIDLRRQPVNETAVQPPRTAKRDRGAA
jgi:hypothetical protein